MAPQMDVKSWVAPKWADCFRFGDPSRGWKNITRLVDPPKTSSLARIGGGGGGWWGLVKGVRFKRGLTQNSFLEARPRPTSERNRPNSEEEKSSRPPMSGAKLAPLAHEARS